MMVNLELAKKVVEEVAPVVKEEAADPEAASLVFAPDGYLAKPLVAETQITRESKPKVQSKKTTVSAPQTTSRAGTISSVGNHFTYGYCTYYVASRRPIPWFGNAITWLAGARAYGFATGNTPQVGAIIVTSEGGRTGHVGIVEQIVGDQITISEMNYAGWGMVSSRTILASHGAIRGYIY